MPLLLRRAYWRTEYQDRPPVDERHCDWTEVPREGLFQLSLVCPNGKTATLGYSDQRIDHRAFQFKIAEASVATGRKTTAQVIGVLIGDPAAGRCVCYAWEYGPPARLVGPFEDNLHAFFYGGGVLRHPSYPVLLGRDLK